MRGKLQLTKGIFAAHVLCWSFKVEAEQRSGKVRQRVSENEIYRSCTNRVERVPFSSPIRCLPSGPKRPFPLAENHQFLDPRAKSLSKISRYYARQLAHKVHLCTVQIHLG